MSDGLTPEQQAKAQAHFAKIRPRCPACGNGEFIAGDLVASGKVEMTGGSEFGVSFSRSVPLLLVVCKRCYLTLHFAWFPIERGHL